MYLCVCVCLCGCVCVCACECDYSFERVSGSLLRCVELWLDRASVLTHISCSGEVRKDIARINTVITENIRTNLFKFHMQKAGASRLPYDLRLKKTRALRKRVRARPTLAEQLCL